MISQHIRRRSFITLLGGAAAWPLVVRAQQPALPVIGYLNVGEPGERQVAAFRKGLSETGYVEGRNVAIEFRWARYDGERLPELVADLIRRRVAVIATPASMPAAFAAKALTTTIPIVFSGARDPVQAGLVASLNRPGGNVTGVTSMNVDIGPKRLGLLRELVPRAARFAVLVNPTAPITDSEIADLQSAASAVGRQLDILTASTNHDIETAFANLAQKQIDALVISPNTLFGSRRAQIVTLATFHRVPVIYSDRAYTEIGGLMSYGGNLADTFRQTGIYTGRVLKGEKPADLPVMRATKFEFVINLHTARAFGLTVPPGLLAIADEVIE